MPMPEGFDPTTGFPPGVKAVALIGTEEIPVVRVGCNGDPVHLVDAWTSYEKPKLSPEAIEQLETTRWLYGDCYVTLEDGRAVSPAVVVVVGRPTVVRGSIGVPRP